MIGAADAKKLLQEGKGDCPSNRIFLPLRRKHGAARYAPDAHLRGFWKKCLDARRLPDDGDDQQHFGFMNLSLLASEASVAYVVLRGVPPAMGLAAAAWFVTFYAPFLWLLHRARVLAGLVQQRDPTLYGECDWPQPQYVGAHAGNYAFFRFLWRRGYGSLSDQDLVLQYDALRTLYLWVMIYFALGVAVFGGAGLFYTVRPLL